MKKWMAPLLLILATMGGVGVVTTLALVWYGSWVYKYMASLEVVEETKPPEPKPGIGISPTE